MAPTGTTPTPSGDYDWTPHLREGEVVRYDTSANGLKVMLALFVGMVFFGYAAWDFYTDFYVYESVAEACADSANSRCARDYFRFQLLVPLSGAFLLYSLAALVLLLSGKAGLHYAVTNQRALADGYGILNLWSRRGIGSIELSDATVHEKRFGIEFTKGKNGVYFTLRKPQIFIIRSILSQRPTA